MGEIVGETMHGSALKKPYPSDFRVKKIMRVFEELTFPKLGVGGSNPPVVTNSNLFEARNPPFTYFTSLTPISRNFWGKSWGKLYPDARNLDQAKKPASNSYNSKHTDQNNQKISAWRGHGKDQY